MNVARSGKNRVRIWGIAGSLLTAACLGIMGGCNPDENSSSLRDGLSSTCQVPSDQRASFMAPVARFPVTIVIDDAFTKDQARLIQDAVDVWNSFARGRNQKEILRTRLESISSWVRSSDPHDCEDESPFAQYEFLIIRELSNEHWQKIGFGNNVPGATIRCENNRQVARQVIFVNTEVVQPYQLPRVFTHEIGHSLGLDHSCNPDGDKVDFRACAGLDQDLNHPYRQAIMYPWLKNSTRPLYMNGVWAPEKLQSNDQVRGACVL